MIPISAVVACTPSYGIGMSGTLPWLAAGVALPKDVKYFKHATSATVDPNKKNAVIMGRKTFESIPEKYKPLSNRLNFVITRDTNWKYESVEVASSLNHALEILSTDKYSSWIEKAVVVGGVKLFEDAILHPNCIEFHFARLDK